MADQAAAECQELIDAYVVILSALKQETESIKKVIPIIRATANSVVRNEWNSLKTGDKAQLIKIIDEVKGALADKYPPLNKILCSINNIIQEPWKSANLQHWLQSKNGTLALANDLWEEEGPLLLEARLEYLLSRKGKADKIAVLIAKVFYLKGTKIFQNFPQSYIICENEEGDDDLSNLCSYSYSTFTRFRTIYFILLFKFRDKERHDEYEDILFNSWDTAIVISQLLEKICDSPIQPIRRFASGWKGWELSNSAALQLASDSTLKALSVMTNNEVLRQLLFFWIDLIKEKGKDEEENVFNSIYKSLCSAYSTDYVHLVEDVLSKYSIADEAQRRVRFYKLKILALTLDAIKLEMLGSLSSSTAAEIEELSTNLAKRHIELANTFNETDRLRREFWITAFSLDPTKELLDKIFGVEGNENTTISINDIVATDFTDKMKNDLLSAIVMPRLETLIVTKGFREMCEAHLEKRGTQFVSNLQYLDLQFEKYEHMPLGYDAEDDGFETGYGPRSKNEKRIKFRVPTGKRVPKTQLAKLIKRNAERRGNSFKKLKSGGVLDESSKNLRTEEIIVYDDKHFEVKMIKESRGGRGTKVFTQREIDILKTEKYLMDQNDEEKFFNLLPKRKPPLPVPIKKGVDVKYKENVKDVDKSSPFSTSFFYKFPNFQDAFSSLGNKDYQKNFAKIDLTQIDREPILAPDQFHIFLPRSEVNKRAAEELKSQSVERNEPVTKKSKLSDESTSSIEEGISEQNAEEETLNSSTDKGIESPKVFNDGNKTLTNIVELDEQEVKVKKREDMKDVKEEVAKKEEKVKEDKIEDIWEEVKEPEVGENLMEIEEIKHDVEEVNEESEVEDLNEVENLNEVEEIKELEKECEVEEIELVEKGCELKEMEKEQLFEKESDVKKTEEIEEIDKGKNDDGEINQVPEPVEEVPNINEPEDESSPPHLTRMNEPPVSQHNCDIKHRPKRNLTLSKKTFHRNFNY